MDWRKYQLDMIAFGVIAFGLLLFLKPPYDISSTFLGLLVMYMVLRDKTEVFTKVPSFLDVVYALAWSVGVVILANLLETTFR